METIEERAIEFAKITPDNNFIAFKSYTRGAIVQREIDIEKACEWLKVNAWSFAHSFDGQATYDTEMAIDTFRKSMMEE